MDDCIMSEKQQTCRQNESCRKEVKKCLLHQVRNYKVTKLSNEERKEIKDIELEIEELYNNIEKKYRGCLCYF